MNQITKLKDALSARYNVDIDVFLDAYISGATRAEVEILAGVTEFPARTIASALNLRWPQKFRQNDYTLLLSRDSEDSSALADKLVVAQEDLKQYEHDLNLKDKQLIKIRREINRLRQNLREESLEEALLDVLEVSLSEAYTFPAVQPIGLMKSTDNTDFVVLSDFHAGATISIEDVPDNEFNWDILQDKVNKLFRAAAKNISGNTIHFYILGDMIDGLIHDSLEASDMNPAKAAKKLGSLLSQYIAAFAEYYEVVHVYCLNGNHSRLTDKIKSVNKGFDFEFLMYSIMEAQLENIAAYFEISTTGMITVEIAPGIFAGLHHGDNFRGASNSQSRDLQILERYRQIGPEVSHMIQGHTHIFEIHELSTGGFAICNGALIGANGYVHTNGFIPVSPIQVIGSWSADGQLATAIPVVL